MANTTLVPLERIESRILFIRGQKVMLDADLAELYGVPTKRLKEQVRRNADRFPTDFMFELTAEEKAEVVANCDHLKRLKFSPYLPSAFTEHGALMLANVLNSERAVQVSVPRQRRGSSAGIACVECRPCTEVGNLGKEI